ncbi:hypothetical protein CDAR_417271 [Caerostris darwini]|uniref:Uncharacterized protein n=1 Tax=Caerostris darwini TaxID=1538125 RepID=A0AAV4X8Z3_9ARAC|nr:hypothetical protein CDAR_417271 [Caerostris darwini]
MQIKGELIARKRDDSTAVTVIVIIITVQSKERFTVQWATSSSSSGHLTRGVNSALTPVWAHAPTTRSFKGSTSSPQATERIKKNSPAPPALPPPTQS